MADITPIASLKGKISPIASLTGELAMPEKVWMQGPPGEPGASATVTVGTVTTGESGTDAIVTNSGTKNAAVLDFTIPKGENGVGVPDGGTAGQLLGKTESGTAWIDPPQSGVQPDWNQNDETQPDYVKNRPFYTGNPVETVFVEESTVSFAAEEGAYIGQLESTFSATVGETYKVSWDGTVYECTCVNFNDTLIIGNLSILGAGSNTGEPFLMLVKNGQGLIIGTTDTSASHTFSISGIVTEVVKIDGKYLIQSDWNQNDETQPDYVKNRPLYTKTTETVLVEERNVGFYDNGNGFYNTSISSTFEATIGETYKVSWDGAAYECTCVNSNGSLYIGNLSIKGAGSDTGEPFVMNVVNGSVIAIVTSDTSNSHTFSINSFVSQIVKIDEKYLPDTIATKSEVEDADTTANTAKNTAENAQNMANSNKEVLYSAFGSTVTFTFDKQTSGRDTFVFNGFNFYKISDFNPALENVVSFKGTRESGIEYSKIMIGSNCVQYGLFIVVAAAGVCSLTVADTASYSFTAPSAGLYAMYSEGHAGVTAGTAQFTLMQMDGLTIKSSTANSTKRFRITVDDSGTISATEVT